MQLLIAADLDAAPIGTSGQGYSIRNSWKGYQKTAVDMDVNKEIRAMPNVLQSIGHSYVRAVE